MKRIRIIMVASFLLAISSAFVSNAGNKVFLKNGFRQDATACTPVTNVPNNCSTLPGTFCGFYNAQKIGQSATCIDALNHP